MHFRSAASQQVNESSVEGHDGISQMNSVLLVLLFSSKPEKKNMMETLNIPLNNPY